jgi:hypothetical protein
MGRANTVSRSFKWLGAMGLCALYYFLVLPAGYLVGSNALGCCTFGASCCESVHETPGDRVLAAAFLYAFDFPSSCPTVHELVDARYLEPMPELDGIEIHCDNGQVSVTPDPAERYPRRPLGQRLAISGCGFLNAAAYFWVLPLHAARWTWHSAAQMFVRESPWLRTRLTSKGQSPTTETEKN